MATFKKPTNASSILFLFLLLSSILTSTLPAPAAAGPHVQQSSETRIPKIPVKNRLQPQELNEEGIWRRVRSTRRMLIGSRAPVCTFNECRGCPFKCTAEQVPVDGSDPMNSAYHYKCVCHR